MNKTFQRAHAIKYLRRGFEVVEHDSQSEDEEFKELSTNDLYLASLCNSAIYIGDQLGEIDDKLKKLCDVLDHEDTLVS